MALEPAREHLRLPAPLEGLPVGELDRPRLRHGGGGEVEEEAGADGVVGEERGGGRKGGEVQLVANLKLQDGGRAARNICLKNILLSFYK